MNILHLRAVLLAHQQGSISAAARALGKRQSQVSQWIADLEIDLGISFFERTGNRIYLSEQGQALLPVITGLVSQADKLALGAQALTDNEPLSLTIGIDNYIPSTCLQRALSHLLDLNINLEVVNQDRSQLVNMLTAQTLDIAIVSEGMALNHHEYGFSRLGHYGEVLVVASHHPLAKQVKVTIDQLSQYRELIWSREESGDDDEIGFSHQYLMVSELGLLKAVLSEGKGFAFLPQSLIEREVAQGKLVVLTSDFEQTEILRRVELLWDPALEYSQIGKQVLQLMQQHHGFIIN
ncbi:LysR family transcriptional regulator [Photobacterium jeanii]|uniref:LysR family transcriptional regulator n=1 Tax=Photobacterium jeanii TaxID=858640 RepID=A0A178K1Y2_9GAMM|nr:LysR family transcriptional regulator [Photobacterium jeanii]OAN11117.1 LysR family transcriptional regulator [Photobacterium jeanii]PST90632.1 LysR family transcriptional regulator [Photobacterium jeanii]